MLLQSYSVNYIRGGFNMMNYGWFMEILEARGRMDTDFATLNYLELEDVYYLIEAGSIARIINADQGLDYLVVV